VAFPSIVNETAPVQIPEVEYARSGDVSIAYQVIGEGQIDLLVIPFINNLAHAWAHPLWPKVYERLTAFSRLIMFDKRGTGLSDRFGELPTLEVRMDDVRAVLDEVGSEWAALIGFGEGNHLAALFAATYPERTSALVLYNPVARYISVPDYPWGQTKEEWSRLVERVGENWGRQAFFDDMLRSMDPILAEDEEFRRWHAALFRLAASPGSAAAFYRMMMETDVRDVLPAIRVPTLVCYREDYSGPSRFVAERIPSAQAVEIPGIGYFAAAPAAVFDEIERFLSGGLVDREPDRVLVTLLFTDIVGSTELATRLGDRGWRGLLEKHDAAVRCELERFRGHEANTTGDGFLATFDGPARGIRCASAIRDAVREVGLEIRAGLHTGECELVRGEVAGIAVHTAARVAALAESGKVLVSSTVKDLVAGSGIEFESIGDHELKGVPGEWRLFVVRDT
jgi:class 3 adenylate cyclase/pimeloyl-ACP methyl ester carboxylesterase